MKTHKVIIDSNEVFISQKGNLFKVIKPWKNEDGTINWFSLLTGGSWINLVVVTVVVLIILGLLNEYATNINILLDCFKDSTMLEACKKTFGGESLNTFSLNP